MQEESDAKNDVKITFIYVTFDPNDLCLDSNKRCAFVIYRAAPNSRPRNPVQQAKYLLFPFSFKYRLTSSP